MWSNLQQNNFYIRHVALSFSKNLPNDEFKYVYRCHRQKRIGVFLPLQAYKSILKSIYHRRGRVNATKRKMGILITRQCHIFHLNGKTTWRQLSKRLPDG